MPWLSNPKRFVPSGQELDPLELIAKLVERIERLEWRVLLLEGDRDKQRDDSGKGWRDENGIPF